MCALTWLPSPSRNLPLVFCASSQAISAETIGLRAKAIAMPVEKCSDGAASEAAAMFIHGTWWPSVNSMPEKPAFSTRRARSATLSHVVARVMTSNSIAYPAAFPAGYSPTTEIGAKLDFSGRPGFRELGDSCDGHSSDYRRYATFWIDEMLPIRAW